MWRIVPAVLCLALAPGDYTTAARPNGVAGGAAARELAKAVADALRARSGAAEADGALASAAAWFVGADDERRQRGSEAAARRAGFVGAVLTTAAFPVGDDGTWRRALAALALNVPVTRFGVHVSTDGRLAGVVFGDVALELEPFPRSFRAGGALKLRGDVAGRFERASVHVTAPDGRVGTTRFSGRRFDKDVALPVAGVYRVEVMGEGDAGPVVVANVPVYVGVEEPAADSDAEASQRGVAPRSAEEARARMLALLNEARRAARLAPMALDAELSAVALAHSQEMSAARFFGHQSPTTGRSEDRLRRAGVSVMKLGENITQGDTAEVAHRALMDSPGHRANMLDPAFTHVGIGAVLRTTETPALLVTMVFARRPRIQAGAVTSAVAGDLVSSRRRARGLAPLKPEPSLQRAAEVGLQVVLKATGPVVPGPALDAAHAALVSEARRLHQPVPKVCGQLAQVVDLEQLDENPILADPGLGRIGLAAAARQGSDTILVLTLAESTACK